MELHEYHRNVNLLVYLDTPNAVFAFKVQSVFVVFPSYQ